MTGADAPSNPRLETDGALPRRSAAFRWPDSMSFPVKACCVYSRADGYFVHAESQTVESVWILQAPVERVQLDAPDAALGAAVRRALARSRTDVAHPSDWMAFRIGVNRALNEVGISSVSKLHTGARLVSLRVFASAVCVTPTRNGGGSGPDRGFDELAEMVREIAEGSSDAELGQAVVASVAVCE